MHSTRTGFGPVTTLATLEATEARGWLKRPNPLRLKCDTNTSPRRLVYTFIHQMVLDFLNRDKPIKVAIKFRSWSTIWDISSEWG